MEYRARGEVQLACAQGLPLSQSAAESQVAALNQARSWVARKYNIRYCCECGEPFQPSKHTDGPVFCSDCTAELDEPRERDLDA